MINVRTQLHLVLLLVSGLILTACSDTAQRASSPVATLEVNCSSIRKSDNCKTIRVGGIPHRYTVIRGSAAEENSLSAKKPLNSAVLIDLGGPGFPLFGSDAAKNIARDWPKSQTLVFLEEPWVTGQPTAPCRSSLREFQSALRANIPTKVDRGVSALQAVSNQLVEACAMGTLGKWGWTPDAYRAVVGGVLSAENLELEGVVGTSFGAHRLRSLFSTESLKWIILNSPAITGVAASSYLQLRSENVIGLFAAFCQTCNTSTDVMEEIEKSSAWVGETAIVLENRTPPVESIDFLAGLIGLTYVSVPEISRSVTAVLKRDEKILEDIGSLSDSVLLRYGEYEMSTAALAYYDELCPAYTSWDFPSTPSNAVQALLAAMHTPCLALANQPGRQVTAHLNSSLSLPTCIGFGGNDFVLGQGQIGFWRTKFLKAKAITLPKGGHGDPNLNEMCLNALK